MRQSRPQNLEIKALPHPASGSFFTQRVPCSFILPFAGHYSAVRGLAVQPSCFTMSKGPGVPQGGRLASFWQAVRIKGVMTPKPVGRNRFTRHTFTSATPPSGFGHQRRGL